MKKNVNHNKKFDKDTTKRLLVVLSMSLIMAVVVWAAMEERNEKDQEILMKYGTYQQKENLEMLQDMNKEKTLFNNGHFFNEALQARKSQYKQDLLLLKRSQDLSR